VAVFNYSDRMKPTLMGKSDRVLWGNTNKIKDGSASIMGRFSSGSLTGYKT